MRGVFCLLAVLLPAGIVAAPVLFHVDGFTVEGDNQLSVAETTTLLQPYTGDQTGLENLQAAAEALEQAYQERGYTFYRVILPPQTLEGGQVKLQVVGIRLGVVQVSGNQRDSREQILRSLPPLQTGKVPDNRRIARALVLANRNPARQTLISLKQGVEPDTIDADLKVQERRPWTLFGAVNNIGSDTTGQVRMTAGGQYNDLLGYDDSLTVVYTISQQRPQQVKQYGVTYSVPLYPNASTLSLYHSRSDVDTGTIGDFTVSGAGRFFGISVNHLFLRRGAYAHEMTVSLEDRLFLNDAVFNNTVNLGVDVRSRPLTLSYQGRYQQQRLGASFYGSYVVNTGGGNRNNQNTYTLARAGAVSDWDLFRLGGEARLGFASDWEARLMFDAQLSHDALIPGEQFGLGGMHSVRGFDERALAADSGARLSAELWMPPVSFIKGLRFLAFVDSGYKDLEATTAGETSGDLIASAGLGARWQWREYLSLSLDYGHVINHAAQLAGGDRGNVKWHFNMLLKY